MISTIIQLCYIIKPDKVEHINSNRCLKYDDTESGLSKLLTMICNNEICFRSLFPCSSNEITYADIMNVCAAFELQFDISVKQNYKYLNEKLNSGFGPNARVNSI